MEVKNAIIEKVTLSIECCGFLDCWVDLSYGYSKQGFGGYVLYTPRTFKDHEIKSHAGHFITRLMDVAGVTNFDAIKARIQRFFDSVNGRKSTENSMKRIYLSGPMTGLPKLNFPAFKAEAERLRELGYDVVNPAELSMPRATPWADCMRHCLKAMLDCEMLALLDGWQHSAGAHLEIQVAHKVGIRIIISKEIE